MAMQFCNLLAILGAFALLSIGVSAQTNVIAPLGYQAREKSSPNQLTAEEKTAGWKLLFDGHTMQGWRGFKKKTVPEKGWEVADGWLHCLGQHGGDIITEGQFDQFDLQWEWKLAAVGNSGVKYFLPETRASAIGHEYQLIDDEKEPDGAKAEGKRVTAAFYDVLKPAVKTTLKSPGEINSSRILVQGNHVEHWLNGVKVLEYECGSDAVKAAVANSKFKDTPGFGIRAKGHILLQDHNSQVWFRNIKIRDLSAQ